MFGKKVKFQFSQIDKAGWLHFKTSDGNEVEIPHQQAEEVLFYFGKRGLRTSLSQILREKKERKEMEEKLKDFISRKEEI